MLPFEHLDSPIRISILTIRSVLGNIPESFYTAIETGLTQTKIDNNFVIHTPQRDYPEGLFISSCSENEGLDRENRIRSLLTELDCLSGESSPLFIQLPKLNRTTKELIEKSFLANSNFSEYHEIDEDCSTIRLLNYVINYLKQNNFKMAYLLVADSAICYQYLMNKAVNTPLADSLNPRGFIAGEGAVLLQISVEKQVRTQQSIHLLKGLEYNNIQTKTQTISAINEAITKLVEPQPSPVPVLIVDNPALGIEEKWSGVRLSLNNQQKQSVITHPILLAAQCGIAGVAQFWLSMAYLQGMKNYPFVESTKILVIEALEESRLACYWFDLNQF
jgi:hypothetical protein